MGVTSAAAGSSRPSWGLSVRRQVPEDKLFVTFRGVRLSAPSRCEEAQGRAAAARLRDDEAPESFADERGHGLPPGLGHRPHLPFKPLLQEDCRSLHMRYANIYLRGIQYVFGTASGASGLT